MTDTGRLRQSLTARNIKRVPCPKIGDGPCTPLGPQRVRAEAAAAEQRMEPRFRITMFRAVEILEPSPATERFRQPVDGQHRPARNWVCVWHRNKQQTVGP